MPTKLLRHSLIADAAASATMGVLLVAGAGFLSGFLELPQPLLLYVGLFLILFAGLVLWTGTRPSVPRPLAWLIVTVNTLWVVKSVVILTTNFVSPNIWGIAFVAVQAIAAAALGIAECVGLLRRSKLA